MTYTDWNTVPLMLNLKEAADVLNVHTNTVRALIGDERLKAQKVGKEWRFSKAEVRRFIEHPDAPPGSDVYGQMALLEKRLERLEAKLTAMGQST